MTLRVPFEQFSDAVRLHLQTRDVYAQGDRVRTIISAADSDRKMIVIATVHKSFDEVQALLSAEGLKVHSGIWSLDDDHELLSLPYIGAVSYRANKNKTGVWVGAYDKEPTPIEVLQEVYEEFRNSGELTDISLDDFVEAAQTTVVVLSPSAIEEITNRHPQ